VIALTSTRRQARHRNDPISFVAAEIHLGFEPAGIYGGWLAILYSSCVPTQHPQQKAEKSNCYEFCGASNE